jgi:peroxiredoxin
MKISTVILMLLASTASAQLVQNFSLTNVVNEKVVSLSDYASYAGVVVIFTTNTCPYDGYYLDRIREIGESYKEKVPLLLVNSDTDPAESVSQMKNYSDQCKLSMPYLADKEQKVFTLLNPRKSPECFILQNNGGKFSIVYRGAIDDNAQTASEVDHAYLKEGIEKMLVKKKIEVSDIRPVGCSIRKK